ncbi:MAG: hypothetical protein ACI90V_008716 [Bacillariaceae sp.]
MQTHSPSQYFAALSASASFCAFVFLLPNTFKLVLLGTDDVVVVDAIADGRTTNADVVATDKHNNAKIIEMMEVDDFMILMYVLASGKEEDFIGSIQIKFCIFMG